MKFTLASTLVLTVFVALATPTCALPLPDAVPANLDKLGSQATGGTGAPLLDRLVRGVATYVSTASC